MVGKDLQDHLVPTPHNLFTAPKIKSYNIQEVRECFQQHDFLLVEAQHWIETPVTTSCNVKSNFSFPAKHFVCIKSILSCKEAQKNSSYQSCSTEKLELLLCLYCQPLVRSGGKYCDTRIMLDTIQKPRGSHSICTPAVARSN